MGIQNRYGVSTKQVANAAGIYYGGAMIGPLLFGILMDRCKSPIMIVTLANILVVLGSAIQAFAPSIGVRAIFTLLVSRFFRCRSVLWTPFFDSFARIRAGDREGLTFWRVFSG